MTEYKETDISWMFCFIALLAGILIGEFTSLVLVSLLKFGEAPGPAAAMFRWALPGLVVGLIGLWGVRWPLPKAVVHRGAIWAIGLAVAVCILLIASIFLLESRLGRIWPAFTIVAGGILLAASRNSTSRRFVLSTYLVLLGLVPLISLIRSI